MYKNKISIVIILAIISFQTAVGQNNTNSPYTRFGFGQLSDNTSVEQRAMGGAAIGARSPHRINTVNPASYSAADSLTFMFDLGLSTLASRFTDDAGNRNTQFTGNLDYITMKFRLFPNVGFSMGLLPYSFAGYNFFSADSVAEYLGSEDYRHFIHSYSGRGGINQFYTGVSFLLFNRLSLGANMYYMWGDYDNVRHLTFTGASPHERHTTDVNTISVSNLRFRFGAQYQQVFNHRHNLTLGAIFEPKTSFGAEAVRTTTTHAIDTTTVATTGFELPLTFGLGAFYRLDNRWTLGADFSMQQWSNALFFGERGRSLQDSWNLALGLEYQPNFRGRRMRDRVMYRFGANISQPYFLVDGETPGKNFGITFGVGLPLPNTRTMLNMAFEYGRINASPRLQEDYFRITFNIALAETWFFQRRL